jgi:hypothetical protein
MKREAESFLGVYFLCTLFLMLAASVSRAEIPSPTGHCPDGWRYNPVTGVCNSPYAPTNGGGGSVGGNGGGSGNGGGGGTITIKCGVGVNQGCELIGPNGFPISIDESIKPSTQTQQPSSNPTGSSSGAPAKQPTANAPSEPLFFNKPY